MRSNSLSGHLYLFESLQYLQKVQGCTLESSKELGPKALTEAVTM
jgi:hypothetical protein